MNYTTTIDGQTFNLTTEDSDEAIKNDYFELKRIYNGSYVDIQRIPAGKGEALHLKVKVKAPSHYLTSEDDITPKACDSMTADIVCYNGYPIKKVSAYYAPNHYLASPNVFRSGHACIDEWIPFTSSLLTVGEKLVHDMIHDPAVTRYESMANYHMENWHKKGVSSKAFPTINPKLLYAVETSTLPPRRAVVNAGGTPSLPKRTH